VPIEGRDVTAAGDVVIASIVGTIGEHPVNQPRFGVDLDDAEREPLPGYARALTGLPFATADHALDDRDPGRPRRRQPQGSQGGA
jgi:hypothetical protein